MIITLPEVQDIVRQHLAKHPEVAQKIVVEMRTTHHATYDTVDGKIVPRVGDDGEAIKHPITTIDLKLGPRTQSIPLVEGNGSPHEHTPRKRTDVEALIRQQIGFALIEATRKPLTAEEYAALQHEQLVQAAERERLAREEHESERRAALTPEQRAKEDYVREHGEHDYHATLEVLGDPSELLQAAIAVGALTPEQAAADQARFQAWEQRSNERKER